MPETASPSTNLTIPQKLHLVETTMNGRLMERTRHVETAVTALVAGAHHCQYGPPGIAKTMLVDTLCRLIGDVKSFRWLMTRFTTPEELFGMFSLKGMENDEFYRKLDGKMVGTDITFLDEMFKANSAILNALLTLMNEGLFFNGTDVVESRPLIFCGSNELPKDAELAALWDRVTFRMEVNPLRERANKVAMLKNKARQRIQGTVIEPVITWDEILVAQAEAAKVEIPDVVYDTMMALEDNLRREGIEPTPRRWTDCVPIIQANAYRDGRAVADVDDMGLLRHVLWLEIGHIPVVEKAVLQLANPLDKEALDLIAKVDELGAEVEKILAETDNETTRKRRGIEVNGKLTRVSEDLDELMLKVAKSPKRSAMVDEARTRLSNLVDRLLAELFNA